MEEVELIDLGELKPYYRGIELEMNERSTGTSKEKLDDLIVAHIVRAGAEPKTMSVTPKCYAELWLLHMIDKSY